MSTPSISDRSRRIGFSELRSGYIVHCLNSDGAPVTDRPELPLAVGSTGLGNIELKKLNGEPFFMGKITSWPDYSPPYLALSTIAVTSSLFQGATLEVSSALEANGLRLPGYEDNLLIDAAIISRLRYLLGDDTLEAPALLTGKLQGLNTLIARHARTAAVTALAVQNRNSEPIRSDIAERLIPTAAEGGVGRIMVYSGGHTYKVRLPELHPADPVAG